MTTQRHVPKLVKARNLKVVEFRRLFPSVPQRVLAKALFVGNTVAIRNDIDTHRRLAIEASTPTVSYASLYGAVRRADKIIAKERQAKPVVSEAEYLTTPPDYDAVGVKIVGGISFWVKPDGGEPQTAAPAHVIRSLSGFNPTTFEHIQTLLAAKKAPVSEYYTALGGLRLTGDEGFWINNDGSESKSAHPASLLRTLYGHLKTTLAVVRSKQKNPGGTEAPALAPVKQTASAC